MQRNRRLKRMEGRRRNELLQDLTPLMVVVLAIQPAIDLTEHVNVTSGVELKGDLNEGGPMKRLALECAPPTGEFSSRFEGGATGSVCCWLNCHLVFLRG